MFEDTIAAIATPLGEGGLAVIRISGREAIAIADRVFVPAGRSGVKPSLAVSHTVHYGHAIRDGERVDEVLLTVMRSPRTFTREDVVEISCHGGLLPARAVLSAVLSAGARLAIPGEFTRRAFLNGRIDLAQAEAVADVIHARTDVALKAAGEQLAGKLSMRIGSVRDDLMLILAHVEAHIDFPDEDISPDTLEQMSSKIDKACSILEALIRTAPEGRILRRGIRAAIVGRPNAGKSSLLNQLLGMDRAIVSPIAGTTRDTIEETANIRGVPVVFIDTAGLREAGDSIEAEGIRRSHASLEAAELVLHVIDDGEPLSQHDRDQLDRLSSRPRLIVRNKVDGPSKLLLPPLDAPVVGVSCTTGQGIEELKDAIKQVVWSGRIEAGMLEVMINARHQEALQRGLGSLEEARTALRQGLPLELAAMELRSAVSAVGEVVGKTATEDLLDRIFSEFCLGK